MAPNRFGRYEILAEVGDGSMARVYRAWDPAFERVVAVKTVKSEHLAGDSAADYLKRFRREARAVGSLSHPGIVQVFDVGPDFIVMEFVEGRTLRQLLREKERFSPEQAIRLLMPLAEAVDHAHRSGIVHRDIKPANVMVQPDGTPKLMDFGIAHLEMSVMTGAGEILGSPSYMAPEQVTGADVTPSWDIWALATVAYELLTGKPPFQGPITQVIYKVLHEESLPPRQWNAALPPWYDEVFARALGKATENRYRTAVELVAALDLRRFEQALAQLVPDPGPAADPAPAESPPDGELGEPAAAIPAPSTPGLRSRALGVGVSFGLLLGLSSSAVERPASREAPSWSPSSAVLAVAGARADTALANRSGIWANAVLASEPGAARAAVAQASALLPSPVIGATAQAPGAEITLATRDRRAP